MIITPLPLTTYTAGTHPLPETTVPTGLTRAKALFDLTHLTALTLVMSIAIELSQDNGATWVSAGGGGLDLPNSGFTIAGSVITSAQGQVVTVSGITVKLLNPANAQRKIRGAVVLSEDFLTQITVDLT